jgi:CheY-like chemotaxis protein
MPAAAIKILIIEDERDVRLYLVNLLRAHGYEATAVSDIEQGLAFARSHHPSLVVLDAMLPGDNAQRVYMDLRCDTGLCRIPVVLLSSITRRALDGSRLYGPGAPQKHLPEPDAFLAKPPEAEDFLEVVRRLTMTDQISDKEEVL